ncbi:MAG TPA: prephenate dehydrogenase [Kineosporiaceae bacterium]
MGAIVRSAVVVGTGMIGTSVGLALTGRGISVHLMDADPATAHAAAALGAGIAGEPPIRVDVAVLAVPPAAVAPVLADLQRRGTARVHTDAASVKVLPSRQIEILGCDTSSHVGGHPLAGSERSGPYAACGSLFEGRRWVLVPDSRTSAAALDGALAVVSACGATPVMMSAEEHDRAVGLVSHAPHLVASLLAGRLLDSDPAALGLAGQGLRDTTRIAGGRAALWADILAANAAAVGDVLEDLATDLAATIAALRDLDTRTDRAEDALARLTHILQRGVDGRERVANGS